MKVEQIIKENIGIDDHNLPGYQHGDGLTQEGHPAHQAIRADMRMFADDLREMYPSACKFLDIGSGAGYLRKDRDWETFSCPLHCLVSLQSS